MFDETTGRTVHAGRWAGHGGADEAIRHAEASSALAARDQFVLARGARRVAVWIALRAITRPSRTEQEHDAASSGSDALLHHLDAWHRAHVGALLEAASWAQAERRVRTGLRPYRTLPSDRRGDGGRIRPTSGVPVARSEDVPPDDLERYWAAALADVSSSLSAAIDALGNVLALGELGLATEDAWAAFEAATIELCLEPAASLADRLHSRRVLLIVWKTVRRRRPLIAALLRRKLSLDRGRWPGSGLAEPLDG
ncbi:hypothetical protein [Lichenibacterium ramalinae]|uniref:Uncharacterized protein n=1 Tax=Lichenibacterium ramalinae TaxID=2316527 RepID=A0A4Q2REA6_9HYPH|nr:hypothetical protein [Lichenibacterium ramalinae]RYB04444.1 hypothetical protein D3272_13490 [Lichenibacterium ramalinae]